jgi:hypothetical protein
LTMVPLSLSAVEPDRVGVGDGYGEDFG